MENVSTQFPYVSPLYNKKNSKKNFSKEPMTKRSKSRSQALFVIIKFLLKLQHDIGIFIFNWRTKLKLNSNMKILCKGVCWKKGRDKRHWNISQLCFNRHLPCKSMYKFWQLDFRSAIKLNWFNRFLVKLAGKKIAIWIFICIIVEWMDICGIRPTS